MITELQNFGNMLFFAGGIKQIIRTYKNRHDLKDLEPLSFCAYLIALTGFQYINIQLGAWIAFGLSAFQMCFHAATIYWIVTRHE